MDINQKYGALTGGGRYDWLVGVYGKKNLPAIGFGFGYSGTIEKLKDCGIFTSPNKITTILISCENYQTDYEPAIELSTYLRIAGHSVELDFGNTYTKDKYKYSIILKRNFCKNHLAEVHVNHRSNTAKIDDFAVFSKSLKF